MKHLAMLLAAALLLLATPPGAARQKKASMPKAAKTVDLKPGKKAKPGDTGLFSIAAQNGNVWVGRARGVKRVKEADSSKKFFPASSTKCTGEKIIALAAAEGNVWTLFGPDGDLCVLDPETGKWHIPGGWRMQEKIAGGTQMLFVPFPSLTGEKQQFPPPLAGRLLLNGEGGPDTEGINVIDPAHEKWLGQFKTKPVQAFAADPMQIWAAVSQGILRIDARDQSYKYYLHSEHGCGADVTGLASTDHGVFIATRPAEHTELGLTMRVFKDGLAVLDRHPGKRYTFRWRYYANSDWRRFNDHLARLLQTRRMDTPGGLCRWDGEKWSALTTKTGLPGMSLTALAAGDTHLYAATDKGLAVVDIKTFTVTKTLPDATGITALAADGDTLWVASEEDTLYRLSLAALLP